MPDEPARYERRDADVGRIARYAAVGGVLFLALHAGTAALLSAFGGDGSSQQGAAPPEPRLQEDPEADLQRLRAWEDEQLSTWGWEDRAAGRVRMPVDRALERVLERGR